MTTHRRSTRAFLVGALLGAASCGPDVAPPDIIFVGDHIISMDPEEPILSAIGVRDGIIAMKGPVPDILPLAGPDTRIVELGEQALLPGFIDAHGHFTGAGRQLDALLLHPPPVGDVSNIDDIVEKIRRWIEDNDIPPGEAVLGSGYDDSLLEEGRHPTRFDLDRASTEHPIAIGHVSGHLRSANSVALEMSGIDASTPDPEGGHLRRVAGTTEPNGVLEERAQRLVTVGGTGPMTEEEFDDLVRKSIDVHLSYGITTIQNGSGSGPNGVNQIRAVAEREPLDADLAVFASASSMLDGSMAHETEYRNGFRVAGVKFVLDGSPQGRTAWVTEPYHEGPPGAPADYRAYGIMLPDVYKDQAAGLIERGIPFLAHGNGDAAMDLMIEGVSEAVAGMDPMPDHRSVIIHAQLMRADQLDIAAELDIIPSFFAAHTFFWGDWHVRSFGEERGTNISPARWATDRGVSFTIHNDAPVVPPDIMRLVSIAVNRKSRSGRVLGPHQRLTVEEALHAVTLGAAYQYFEEDTKGSITVGKQADLVILETNPLTADPETLDQIQVVETFSRGRSVFRR